MLLRSQPAGFIAPCLPTPILRPPTGPLWVHEIKHDGYRMMAWRDGDDVRLYTRRGYDWSERYPAVVAAVQELKIGSCLIDGELVVCDGAGRHRSSRQRDHFAFLYAFDLDLRREPLETRKATLASLLRNSPAGISLCEHLEADGEVVFRHGGKMGMEGIVSKQRDGRYSSAAMPNWVKNKNPHRPAVMREAAENGANPDHAETTPYCLGQRQTLDNERGLRSH
jgi:bifunctional non-homologous end joining protein LigD